MTAERPDLLSLRSARPTDADGVAALHADSWQRHYRGAYANMALPTSDRLHLSFMWVVEDVARAGQAGHCRLVVVPL